MYSCMYVSIYLSFFLPFFLSLCVCMCKNIWHSTNVGHKTSGRWVYSPTMWITVIKMRLLGLMESTFNH